MSRSDAPAGRIFGALVDLFNDHLVLPALIGAYACLVLAAILRKDYPAVAILALTALLPLLMFVGLRILLWRPLYAEYACTALIVLESSTFRFRDIDDKSVDLQIVMRLACICAMASLAVSAMLHKKFFARQSTDLVFWILFLFYIMATSLIAVSPTMSIVETGSNVIAFVFLVGIAGMLGPEKLIKIMLWSSIILCSMSVFAYVAVPSVGRLSDWVNRSFVMTNRLQGVLNTPNSAGAAAAFCLLMGWLFPTIRGKFVLLLLSLPAVVCLLASKNRMALAALIGAAIFYYLTKRLSALKLSLFALAAALALLAFAIWGDTLLASMARSGSADEILNGTGRTRIWAVVLELWWQKPLFGYGPGSAKFILPHHPLLFKAAAHAHNMYLNILFAAGAVGLAIFLASLVSSIARMTASRSMELMSVLVFYLLYGLTEPTIGGVASFVPMGLFSIAVLSYFARTAVADGPDGRTHQRPTFARALPATGQRP